MAGTRGQGQSFICRSAAENELRQRITARPDVFGGKPIVRDMPIAVEHILGMLAAGDGAQLIVQEYPFLAPAGVQACLVFALRSLAGEQVRNFLV